MNKQFTRDSATKIFYDISVALAADTSYSRIILFFWYNIIPLIAEQRELEILALLGKFASTAECLPKVFSDTPSVAENAESDETQHPAEKVEAAKKLQRIQRGKTARRRAKKLKEVGNWVSWISSA